MYHMQEMQHSLERNDNPQQRQQSNQDQDDILDEEELDI
jgi:hypothetical protein